MRTPPPELGRGTGAAHDLVRLDPDHPGFRDAAYRARRNSIARAALEHRTGDLAPQVAYTEEEHGVWREVWQHLRPLHAARAPHELVELEERLALDQERIPQLADVSARLQTATGFRLEPVAGLVQARTFLSFLGRRTFLATQYVRHPSRPLYTPEPDVIHELIGHAATLVHPGIAAINEQMGRAAALASDAEMLKLERVYWYTLEFGALAQGGEIKASGAGLLSSFGEIQRFDTHAELRDWDLEAMAATEYDPTDYQHCIFVAPSFPRMLLDLSDWVESGSWRD